LGERHKLVGRVGTEKELLRRGSWRGWGDWGRGRSARAMYGF